MNCRPGDLAYLVRDEFAENIGRVVNVLGGLKQFADGPAWRVRCASPMRFVWLDSNNQPTMWHGYAREVMCLDSRLKPIRPSEAQDEVVRRVGKPQETMA